MRWFNILLFVLMILPIAQAVELGGDLSSEDQAAFDEMLEPVMKIYNFIKYVASVIAALFLLFAGITYMTSGSDPRKRDQAKNMATYVVIGLVIIWVTPLIIQFLT